MWGFRYLFALLCPQCASYQGSLLLFAAHAIMGEPSDLAASKEVVELPMFITRSSVYCVFLYTIT